MDQLTQKLANSKRRALGTCAVLLWGPPGSGKSQIAREYLWRHRDDYPVGCFWVDCKTKESRSKSFWDIAQAVAVYGREPPRDPAWDESSKFVDAVRKWLESREGWLLVLDGVTTDNDDDIEALIPFIPDRTGNNIIYTSVDRTLAKRQRLLNPASVKVFPLSQHDACTLLYKNLGIKSPSEVQIKKANQLVKHYECLPLAVHAAAHALIARGTSLEKFTPGTSDHRLAEPYLDILAALRQHSHPEAVNLLRLLSFLGHDIPVALIRFGQPVLQEFGIEIRSIEQIGSMKKELDNTIAVLIRYGLVERTLLEYCVASPNKSSSPTETRHRRAGTVSTTDSDRREPRLPRDDSSSLEGMVETRPDSRFDDSSSQSVTYSIDILRIHTVVQSVLRDELKFRYADQPAQYWWWLSITSKMLSFSYTVAHGRIKATEGRGLVRDYRDYETQAARLWSHFPKSSVDASSDLRKTRHNLHETIRAIKQEIQTQSPSQSIDSLRHRVQFSVFERANSTSSDSPGSNSTNLTRTSTWTPEHAEDQTESPTQMHSGLDMDDAVSDGSWTDRWSQSGMGNSRILIPSANRSRRQSDAELYTIAPSEDSFNTARDPSVLHAIFQGRPSLSKRPKDLGEWKPVPTTAPTLTHVEAPRSRASSFTVSSDDRTTRPTSVGSEASGALAAIHRASPPPPRGGRIKSPTRSQCSRPASEEGHRPLSIKSPNQKLSPLAMEFQPVQSLPTDDFSETSRRHSRHPSSSPRLIQTALNNQAATRMIPIILPDENTSFSRPVDMSMYSKSLPAHEVNKSLSARQVPSGYTSQPMSRDSSRESNDSLATAPPAVPGSASLGTSPQIREPYLYSRPGLASIDVVAANSWGEALAGIGDLENTSPPRSSPVFESRDIFERYHESYGSSVQFGDMSPVEFDQARVRASLARERSMDGRVPR